MINYYGKKCLLFHHLQAHYRISQSKPKANKLYLLKLEFHLTPQIIPIIKMERLLTGKILRLFKMIMKFY